MAKIDSFILKSSEESALYLAVSVCIIVHVRHGLMSPEARHQSVEHSGHVVQ